MLGFACMHISLGAEYLFALFGIPFTNSILTTWIVALALILAAFFLRKRLTTIPGKFQSSLEMVYEYFMETATSVIGRKDVADALFPFLMTLFLFITLSNWTGLLPGNASIGLAHHAEAGGEATIISFLRPPTADINLVAAMSVLAVGYIQYLGIRFMSAKTYMGKFFNFSNPINFFIGLLELFSELTRTISFTFRLFGNIFAGKVLVTVIFFLTMSLAPFLPIIPVPFFLLEMFVGLIQAFVFSFLVIVLTAVAVTAHGENHH